MKQFEAGKLVPNINALASVLHVMKKVYKSSIKLANSLIYGTTPNTKKNIRKYYSESAGLYYLDYTVWCSIHSDKE